MKIQQYKPQVNAFYFDAKEDLKIIRRSSMFYLTPLRNPISGDSSDTCT